MSEQGKNNRVECEMCLDTGFYGEGGPGVIGNAEWIACENCNPTGIGAGMIAALVILVNDCRADYLSRLTTAETAATEYAKQAAELLEEVERLRGEMPNCVKPGDGKGGWSLDYKQVLRVKELACAIEDVCMEKTEAVMLAMIECGQALAETETE